MPRKKKVRKELTPSEELELIFARISAEVNAWQDWQRTTNDPFGKNNERN